MSDCKAAPEYEVGGYYWITLTTSGQMSDQYVYRGRAYNTPTYHVLEARHHKGQFVTLSNSHMERFSERIYDRPKKDEVWELTGSVRGGPFYFLSTVKVVDTGGDWVIYTTSAASTGRRAILLSEFSERYRKADDQE